MSDFLALDLINRTSAPATSAGSNAMGTVSNLVPKAAVFKSVSDYLAQTDTELTDRFDALKAMILELGDDVEMKTLKLYFAFRRLKNFACVEVHPQTRELVGYVKHPAPATLAKAFRGELVPQDPADDPASVLLKCLHSQPAGKPGTWPGRCKSNSREKMPRES